MEIFLESGVWAEHDFLSLPETRPLEPDFLRLVRFGRAPFQHRRRGTAWTVRKLERCLFIVLCFLAFVRRTTGPPTHSRSILGWAVGRPRCLRTTKEHLLQFVHFLRTEKGFNSQALVYALQALADYFHFVGSRADQLFSRKADEDPVHLSSEHFDARELGRTLPSQISVYAEEQARQFGSLSIFKEFSKPKLGSSVEEGGAQEEETESVQDTNQDNKNKNRFDKLSTTEFAWLNSWQALLGAQVKAQLDPIKEENKRWRLARPLEKDLRFDWVEWTEAVRRNVWNSWLVHQPRPESLVQAVLMVQQTILLVFTCLPQTRASVLCGLRFGTTLVEKHLNGKRQFVIRTDRLSEHSSRHKMWPKYLEEGVEHLLKPCFLLEDEHDLWHEFVAALRKSNADLLSTDLVFPSLQFFEKGEEPFVTAKLKASFSPNLLENLLLYGKEETNPPLQKPMTEQEMEANLLQTLDFYKYNFDRKFLSIRLFHFRKLAETALRQFALSGTEAARDLWEPLGAESFARPKTAASKTITQNKLSLHKNTDPYIDFRSTNPLNARVVDALSGMCKRILQQRGWGGITFEQIVRPPFLPSGDLSKRCFWKEFLHDEQKLQLYEEGPVSKVPSSGGTGDLVPVKLAFWLNRIISSDPSHHPVDKFSIGLSEVLPNLDRLEGKAKEDWVLVLSSFRVHWTWLCAILKIQGYLVENEVFSQPSPRIFILVPTMQKASVQRSVLMRKYSKQIQIFLVGGSRWHANSFSLFTPEFLRLSVCSAVLRPAPWSLQTEIIWMRDFKAAHQGPFDQLKKKWRFSQGSGGAYQPIPDEQAASALRQSLNLYNVDDSLCWYTGWAERTTAVKPTRLVRSALGNLEEAAPRVLCLQVSANSNHQGRFTDQQVTAAFGLQENKENRTDEVRLYWPSKSQMHEATKFPGLALSVKQRHALIQGADTGRMAQALHTYKESAPSRKFFLPHCKLFALFESEELETPEDEDKKKKGLPCLAVLVGSYTLSTQSWCIGASGANVEMGHFVATSRQKALRAIYDFEKFKPSTEDADSTVYAPLHFTPFSKPYTDPQNMFVR